MNRFLVFIYLITAALPSIFAQGYISDFPNDRPIIQYRSNDTIAKQLDYANTVCDTLLYNGEVVLLDESPLLQLSEVKELVQKYQTPLPDDSIYNCQRGYTAQWEIRDYKVYLVGLKAFGNNHRLLKELKKLKALKRVGEKPLLAHWISDSVRGGTDAVKTNYGYAFKKVYCFHIKAGVKEFGESYIELPTGALEDGERLTDFLQQRRHMLYDAFLDTLFVKTARSNGVTQSDRITKEIPLTTSGRGESYYLVPGWDNRTLLDICLDRSTESRKRLFGEIRLANSFPRGSFYPRFLRTGIVYHPTYIQFRYAPLYPDISNAEFVYYVPSTKQNRNRNFPE